jgi:hypothetical protein
MKKIKLKRDGFLDGEIAFIFVIITLVKFIIGVLFLIPPILGVFFFTLNVFDVNWDAVTLRDLGSNWTGEAFSAAPIYLGLMALAGVLLVHFSVKDCLTIFTGNYIDEVEITENGK